jgi:hypothetical protein
MGRITSVRGDFPIRQPVTVPDADIPPSEDFQEVQNIRMLDELRNIANQLYDTSRSVDEYRYITGNITSLEILPDYELGEFIESMIIVANPYSVFPATGGQTSSNYGSAVDPGAGTTVASLALAAGTYTYSWQVNPGSGATVANNFGIYNGATLMQTSINTTSAGWTAQTGGTVVIPSAGATLAVEAIASDSETTYSAQVTATLQASAGTQNIVSVQLGDRYFKIYMPISGVFVANGLGLRLDRDDRRVFTQPVAGPLGANLMGHADTR